MIWECIATVLAVHNVSAMAAATWTWLHSRSDRIVQSAYIAQYGLRLLACLLLLEVLTHSIYANAFARFHLWSRLPAAQSAEVFDAVTMAALAFYKLIFLWLKFIVIWRLARFVALLDGVDPPENMLRCALLACCVLFGILLC